MPGNSKSDAGHQRETASGNSAKPGTAAAQLTSALIQAWPVILDRLRTPENEQGVRTWLASVKVRPVSLDSGVLTVECPTPLFQYTIRDRYAVKNRATL